MPAAGRIYDADSSAGWGREQHRSGGRYASRASYLDVVRSFARALVTACHVLVGLSCA